jgi:3,4-dihydroxy 2-butanone 4-phosphate synthase/GTP cyclohydrolase II
MMTPEAVRVPLPTPYGTFEIHAFESPSGHVYLAMVFGEIGDGENVLVRLHSECLTGDALGSLRCDCGIQLRHALRTIAAEGRGVLIYATGHEGRGIGLVNKLRAYVAQDGGADTVDANLALGLPVDSRDYAESADVLAALGVRTIRLMTNNPRKVSGVRTANGVRVNAMVPVTTAPHHRNVGYLSTKARRLDHTLPIGLEVPSGPTQRPFDAMALLGPVRSRPERPFVVLKYAQSLDGRIATSTGDSKWISGEPERELSHALRAACDAVMVGIGTVLADDPELTVRMVPGASPMRVVLDTSLRLPVEAKIVTNDAATTVITTARSDEARRYRLRERGVRVEVVPERDGRVDLHHALAALRATGTESLLVEGGSTVITALLDSGVVDRLIVAVAPFVMGTGTQAVNDLGIERVTDAIRLENRIMVPAGEDLVLGWDVAVTRRSQP